MLTEVAEMVVVMVALVQVGIDEKVAIEEVTVEFFVDFQSKDFSNSIAKGCFVKN